MLNVKCVWGFKIYIFIRQYSVSSIFLYAGLLGGYNNIYKLLKIKSNINVGLSFAPPISIKTIIKKIYSAKKINSNPGALSEV